VVRSAPDGYTLLFISTANMINATFYKKLPFNFMRDIAPVIGIARVPIVLVVNPSIPVNTVAQFIDYAKANPGRVGAASAGIGTSLHLSAELFKMLTGIELVHMPYRGGVPAITDVIAGQVPAMFDNLSTSLEHIRSGKLRVLGVGTAAPVQTLPGVPTIAETVPGYEASSVFGVGVPTGTPAEVIEKLNGAFNAALTDASVVARLADLTFVPIPGTAAEFGAQMAATTEKWARVIKFSGASAD
jgi:tripartite-type tricarboxylate transporter receptor subunit TctC